MTLVHKSTLDSLINLRREYWQRDGDPRQTLLDASYPLAKALSEQAFETDYKDHAFIDLIDAFMKLSDNESSEQIYQALGLAGIYVIYDTYVFEVMA